MSMPCVRRRLLWILLAAIVLPAVGCGRQPDSRIPADLQMAGDLQRSKPAVDIQTPADFSLTSEEFAIEYEQDRSAAAAKFQGKVIELQGEVVDFGRHSDMGDSLDLKGSGRQRTISCHFPEGEPWRKALPGQEVQIKGFWPSYSSLPLLEACIFVNAGDYQPIILTSQEFAHEHQEDRTGTRDKYRSKHIFLEGTVVGKGAFNPTVPYLELEGSDQVRVFCAFPRLGSEHDETQMVQVGQSVRLLGQFLRHAPDDGVQLDFCLLTREKD